MTRFNISWRIYDNSHTEYDGLWAAYWSQCTTGFNKIVLTLSRVKRLANGNSNINMSYVSYACNVVRCACYRTNEELSSSLHNTCLEIKWPLKGTELNISTVNFDCDNKFWIEHPCCLRLCMQIRRVYFEFQFMVLNWINSKILMVFQNSVGLFYYILSKTLPLL